MRLTDYIEQKDRVNHTAQVVVQLVVAFALCWLGAVALSGCTVQAQAYKTIQGVK